MKGFLLILGFLAMCQGQSEFFNHYEILSVEPDASLKEIKTRYKELARKYHPDMAGPDQSEEDR